MHDLCAFKNGMHDQGDISCNLIALISNSILYNNKKQLKSQEFNTVKFKKN
jgi:hypothetical protein